MFGLLKHKRGLKLCHTVSLRTTAVIQRWIELFPNAFMELMSDSLITFPHKTYSIPLFSRLRWSTSAWSFSRVSLCCCCRNWISFCSETTRGSMSPAVLCSPLSAAGATGSGFRWFPDKRRGEQGFPRHPTLDQCGRLRTGGRF